AELEVDGAEVERAALDDGVFQSRHDVGGTPVRAEIHAQLPRLVRLLGALEPVDPAADRALHVFRLLLLAALAVAAFLPLLHPAQLLLEAGLLVRSSEEHT